MERIKRLFQNLFLGNPDESPKIDSQKGTSTTNYSEINICRVCGKEAIPVEQTQEDHPDWDSSVLHRKCWTELIDYCGSDFAICISKSRKKNSKTTPLFAALKDRNVDLFYELLKMAEDVNETCYLTEQGFDLISAVFEYFGNDWYLIETIIDHGFDVGEMTVSSFSKTIAKLREEPESGLILKLRKVFDDYLQRKTFELNSGF